MRADRRIFRRRSHGALVESLGPASPARNIDARRMHLPGGSARAGLSRGGSGCPPGKVVALTRYCTTILSGMRASASSIT